MKRSAALLLACAAIATGCTRGSRAETLTVFAASSLTDAFEHIAQSYEDAHPKVRVRLSTAGSTTLGRQIRDGAPADVFATADSESMELAGDRRDGEPRTFARNRLAIAVAAGNPKGIASLSDLAGSGVIVVLCAPEVPCGRRTDDMLRRANVPLDPAGRENSVGGVLTKVASGEADAGIVYATDLRVGDDRVAVVPIPSSQNIVNEHPIVALRGRHARSARSFVSFVFGADAQQALRERGFLAP
ncbi:MAG TPA: molybdate ABC transporter substrate-binding protein [Actinomycetota bacterium]